MSDINENVQFYREQAWKALTESVDRLESKVDKIDGKVTWIYGWAAGVGAAAGVIASALMFYVQK